MAHPKLRTEQEWTRLQKRTQRKINFEKNRQERVKAQANLKQAKAEKKEFSKAEAKRKILARKKQESLQQRKASNKETKCSTEESQILALQQVQQEELQEARAKFSSVDTGFKFTEEQCEINRQRRATAKTPREQERMRKAILAENINRYKNYCVSIQVLLEVEEKQGKTSSATSNNLSMTRAIRAYQQAPELGEVRRHSETPTRQRQPYFGGTSAAPQ